MDTNTSTTTPTPTPAPAPPLNAADITAIITAIGVALAALGRIIAAIRGGTSVFHGLFSGTNQPKPPTP